MPRPGAGLALLALAALASACGGAGGGAGERTVRPAAAEEDLDVAPVRGCRSRNESRFPIGDPGPGDVRLGPVYFANLATLATESPSTFTPRAGRHHVSIKVHLAVSAGTRATLVVPPAARARFGIAYAKPASPDRVPFTVANGGAAVALRACSEDTAAFAYDGVVGPWTEFGGLFLVSGPGCMPIELHVAGRHEPYRATLSFGASAC